MRQNESEISEQAVRHLTVTSAGEAFQRDALLLAARHEFIKPLNKNLIDKAVPASQKRW